MTNRSHTYNSIDPDDDPVIPDGGDPAIPDAVFPARANDGNPVTPGVDTALYDGDPVIPSTDAPTTPPAYAPRVPGGVVVRSGSCRLIAIFSLPRQTMGLYQ